MKAALAVCILTLLFGTSLAHASAESLEKVSSRGIEQKFVLTEPDAPPAASVILLAGGHGKLDLSSSSGTVRFGWGEMNNLVRTRHLYADAGFLVATMDAPTDRNKMNAVWRMGESHSKDIDAVARFLKKKADVPVWVIGTSMGTFSAANAGIRLNSSISGIVLTSSVTRSKKKWKIYDDYPKGIINMPLSKVERPVLVVSHKDDGCALTPASDIDSLAKQFSLSAKVDKAVFSGGKKPESDPCKARSAHGFYGIEQEVVDKIAAFIKAN